MAVSEDSLVVGGSRRGRPPTQDPLTPVTIWISHDHFERMRKLADLYDVSVSAFGRKAMERVIDRAIE